MAIKAKKVRRTARQRRKTRIRNNILGHTDRPRLSVFKSSKNTYAQVISDLTGKTLLSVSTQDKEVQEQIQKMASAAEGAPKCTSAKSIAAAHALGKVLGAKALAAEIKAVVFDRNGFLYHGRIEAVANGAREQGLNL